MKPLYWILILFHQSSFAQVYWSDSFQNVNNLTNGVWLGDTTDFSVNNEQKLQLNANGNGSSRLYTHSPIGFKSSWGFYISMDFNPSSANNARVTLAKKGGDGLFVAFGEGGRDLIELGFSKNSQDSIWASSVSNFLDSAKTEGVFQLFQDSTGDYSAFWICPNGNSKVLFSTIGPKAIPSDYFEISCQYTSTRADKFFFDDVSAHGYPFVDLSQPQVIKLEQETEILKLTFSKPVANKNPVYWSDSSLAASIHSNFSAFHEVNMCLPNNINTLNLSAWKDSLGQSVDSIFTFENHEVLGNSIFISEIMHDATPSRGLAEIEYIELYSQKDFYWNKGLLVINNDTSYLPPFRFEKGKTYILSAKPNVAIQSHIPINRQAFHLPKKSGVINIYDDNGILIAYQEYNKNAHHTLGTQGGYSLVRTDFSTPICLPHQLKTTNSSKGGSPGNIELMEIKTWNNQGLTLKYLEGDFLFFRTPTYLKPGKVKAQYTNSGMPFPIQYNPMNRREFFVKTPVTSDTLILFHPLLSHVNDTFPRKWYIEIPQEMGRVEISEVMYDSDEKGEFIEFANAEDYSVFIGGLWIGQWENDVFYQEYKPFSKNWILPANEQLAIVESEGYHRRQDKPIGAIIQTENWKSLVNSGGNLGVYVSGISKPFVFGDNLHSKGIEETKNVSLGREQTFKGDIVSQEKVTLGLKNSFPKFIQDDNYIVTDKNVIQSKESPMKIKISAPPNSVGNLELISLSGESFYSFFENQTLQSEVIISYFGESNAGGKLNPGPYILKLTLFSANGKIKNQLKKIAIAP